MKQTGVSVEKFEKEILPLIMNTGKVLEVKRVKKEFIFLFKNHKEYRSYFPETDEILNHFLNTFYEPGLSWMKKNISLKL
jgi:hypothetical protein